MEHMLPDSGYHPLVLRVARTLAESFGRYEGASVLPPPAGLGFDRVEEGHWYTLREEQMASTCLHLQCGVARKVHLEVTRVGRAFGYVHAMVFPRHDYALPLFGVDVNATPKKVTLSVLHVFPSPDETIPECLEAHRAKVDKTYFERHRPLPEWGEVFRSGIAVIVQPKSEKEEETFFGLVEHFAGAYAEAIREPEAAAAATVRARQHHYSIHKRRNRRGAKVLENVLGSVRASRYVDEFLWPLEV